MKTFAITSYGATDVLQLGERPRPVPGIGELLIPMGAQVIVTAGRDEKCAACLALGANHAINYKTQE
jgi:NADPH2:quinone reductase